MKIGKLRHRVTLQEERVNRDSFGAEVKEWTDIKTVWASIEPISGKEVFKIQQLNAEITTRITMRYLEGVKPTMRVLFKGRIFEILSVINYEERNIFLELLCREEVD